MTTVMSYWDPGCCARPPQQNSFSWEAANEVDAARGQCVRIDAADSLRKALHAGQRQQAGCPAIFEKALHGQTQRRRRGRDGARKIREARARYRLDEFCDKPTNPATWEETPAIGCGTWLRAHQFIRKQESVRRGSMQLIMFEARAALRDGWPMTRGNRHFLEPVIDRIKLGDKSAMRGSSMGAIRRAILICAS